MAKIDSIFKKETKRAEQHPKRITKWIHYTKLVDNKAQYCNERDKEEIAALADLIEADGEILQDLLVRKIDTDEYEIIAGHKRRRACRLLVEERGKESFAFLPCFVKDISNVKAEFQLYSSNGYHEKTEYEKMHELERMKYLLENYPEEFPQVKTGRIVEKLAKLLNMKRTTVGEYLTISKNLGEKGMEKFQNGELKKSAAVTLASLPETKQEELLDHGIVKNVDIQQKIQEEKSEKSREEQQTEEEPVGEKESVVKLIKPDETAYRYFNLAAKKILRCWWEWFCEDVTRRVDMVTESPKAIKERLKEKSRKFDYLTQEGVASINLFDEYVQIWDEDSNFVGDYDWFYFAAAIHRMWNGVSLEKMQEKQIEARMNPPEELSGSTSSEEEKIEPENVIIAEQESLSFSIWDHSLIKKQLEIAENYLNEMKKPNVETPAVMALEQEALVLGLRVLLKQAEE